jgi:UDP-N-acetylglucosamine 1-carboxyvinyltransferase
MDKFVIEGGRPLHGTVELSGAKNACLPLMCASLLAAGTTRLRNVPYLQDVKTMSDVLRVIGAKVKGGAHELEIDTTGCDHLEAPYELVKIMRASIWVLGPLVARFGRAKVSLPGGCAWGPRPIDLHLKGLQAMGAKLDIQHGYIMAEADKLHGANIEFTTRSVGATANLAMAASLAEGVTRLENPAQEPEIMQLIEMLQKMGARIRVQPGRLEIEGVPRLKPCTMDIIPDRIEAGTFLAAVAACGGDVIISHCQPDHLSNILDQFRMMGLELEIGKDTIRARNPGRMKPLDLTTAPYPGFPTDMQAQMMACLCLANGTSTITETIYTDRFTHLPELQRLGADITLRQNVAVIRGVEKLSGAQVMASDLRASAALVIAGLRAGGATEILRVYHLDRGYENMELKLAGLGALIRREKGGL